MIHVIPLCFHVYMCVCVGIGKLRFKPAYNPYTEPSMEVFSYHEGERVMEHRLYCDSSLINVAKVTTVLPCVCRSEKVG